MSNPFENDDAQYFVLRNDENQHSLWPTFAEIPSGWDKAFEGARQDCLAYVEENWTDMRPASLVRAMEG
ncbi:MbtH family NRPS accessory protein [Rhodococcus sp. IEGM 1381]|uniref:MbtH family protein n=1 Tax=Rhodococcus sp. IEGM 1381 TaxID=3047085 RepID=UPI0024B6595F|nr:MbtH family NRPS accessory protein [Rhodococcus sp. IEGM 1381]MDI9894481.1 MbtH family NRPS accessory protein [Rhodococcus sp. IEGM 1381]